METRKEFCKLPVRVPSAQPPWTPSLTSSDEDGHVQRPQPTRGPAHQQHLEEEHTPRLSEMKDSRLV